MPTLLVHEWTKLLGAFYRFSSSGVFLYSTRSNVYGENAAKPGTWFYGDEVLSAESPV
jgi:hypothetical protein